MIKFLKKLKRLSFFVCLLPGIALAQTTPGATVPKGIEVAPAGTNMGTLVATIISYMLWIAGALAVIYLIYGGITYITSAGNAERATAGKNAIIYAIIGIVVIAVAYVIVRWINTIVT